MENSAAIIREDADADADNDDVVSDRISRLPEPILLHILCFLSHKKAVQTCVLSKSWQHLGPTRPVIELRGACGMYSHVRGIDGVCENCFDGNKEAFVSVLDSTFQRYHDQNLFTQELHLEMLKVDSQSISVLEKWMSIFMNPDTTAVDTILLSFADGPCFTLPSVILKAESLRELYLNRCRLDEIISIDNFLLRNLQKLSLSRIDIADEVLEKMIAGCPLVKSVVIFHCHGFKTINIIGIKNRYLCCFEFSSSYRYEVEHSIEIDAPTLQSIRIVRCSNWYRNHNNYFPHLKSLFLLLVKLSAESIDNFSFNFPCLEELSILNCSGFEEIKLSSRSIKRLTIHESNRSVKEFSIEVPNILYFEFSINYLPTILSVTTTSREWKSLLNFHNCVYVYGDDVLQRILKLFEMVKSLSQSQISLCLSETLNFKINQTEWDFNDNPVLVEHMGLDISKLCPDSLTHFVNVLFRIFRPRYTNAVRVSGNDDEEVTKCLWKILIQEREKTKYGWEQHLEEVSIEASDEEGKVWVHVEWTCLPEWSKNQKIRFRLKWRD